MSLTYQVSVHKMGLEQNSQRTLLLGGTFKPVIWQSSTVMSKKRPKQPHTVSFWVHMKATRSDELNIAHVLKYNDISKIIYIIPAKLSKVFPKLCNEIKRKVIYGWSVILVDLDGVVLLRKPPLFLQSSVILLYLI